MEGAFLLWKLFKKHDGKPDENSEPPNCDEIYDSSPAVVEYSAEDAQLEPITNQPEIQTPSVESFQADNYERVIIDPLSPIRLLNNSCTVDDAELQSLDSTSIQPDPELEYLLGQYCDPLLYPHDSDIFSPLHSQMQSELGCGNHNNGLDELLLQDDTGEFDINELLNFFDFDQPLSDNADFFGAPMAPHPTMMTDMYMTDTYLQDHGDINEPRIIRPSLMNRALTLM